MSKLKIKQEKPIVQQYYENDWEFIHPLSIDQEVVQNEFWNAVDILDYEDQNAERIFKKLITKYPYFIDAYNHLSIAFRNQGKDFESLLTAEKAFSLGKNYIPRSFNFKRDRLIWSNHNNRPFLRACQIYGLELQCHKRFDEAIDIYQLNLALNEGDNQGIRYLLLETFLAAKAYIKAQKLLDKYEGDFSIEFKFGAVALAIIQNNQPKADANLDDAIRTNKFFIEEVIKDRHLKPPPFRIPGEPYLDAGNPVGSVQESFDYWKRNEQLYKTKKIIDYFKSKKKLQ